MPEFLKWTSERCSITVEVFEDGVELYVDDAYLPESVANAVRSDENED